MAAPSAFQAWVNSPAGPRTTHFWGPVANWGLVLAGIYDLNKPAEAISVNMSMVLCGYSALFMRFFWMVTPRNYLGLSCHICNEAVQGYQLQRALRYQWGWDAPKGAAGAAPEAPASAPPTAPESKLA